MGEVRGGHDKKIYWMYVGNSQGINKIYKKIFLINQKKQSWTQNIMQI